MNHEQIRERLALRLYGELDPDEEREIDLHLRDCRDCAGFAGELASGLGRARELHAEASLPPGWDASLSDATAHLRRERWRREALLVGSGLAAGILAMFAWSAFMSPGPRTPAPGTPSVASVDPDAPAFLRFQGKTPPPLATAGGPATRYLAWQAR